MQAIKRRREKLLLAIISLWCISFDIYGQQPYGLPTYNTSKPLAFEKQWSTKAPGITSENIQLKGIAEVQETTTYMDGYGRPIQSVAKKAALATNGSSLMDTSGASDLIAPVVYDALGRNPYGLMPFAHSSQNGQFDAAVFTHQYQALSAKYATDGETKFYSEAVFGTGALDVGSAIESYAPGNSWVGSKTNPDPSARRSVQTSTYFNTSADSVYVIQTVNGSPGSLGAAKLGISLIGASSFYEQGQLTKIVSSNEDHKQVVQYIDDKGKMLLQKTQLTASPDNSLGSGYEGWICTYYVYDDLDRLKVVIQPEGIKALLQNGWNFTSTVLNEQCFRYEYDKYGHVIMKKFPGSGTDYMVYDKAGKLVMTQDARNRPQNIWNYIQYDTYNRTTATGTIVNSNSVTSIWAQAQSSNTFPVLDYTAHELSASYYDNYNWVGNNGAPFIPADVAYSTSHESYFVTGSAGSFPFPETNAMTSNTKGMVTGGKMAILNSPQYLYSLSLYNDKGRNIQTKSFNHTGAATPDVVTAQYSWSGQVLTAVNTVNKAGGNALQTVTATSYSYDMLGRLLTTGKKVAVTIVATSSTVTTEKILARHLYDEMGQVKTKYLGVNPQNLSQVVETQDFEYNIRGWLKGMNRPYITETSGGGGSAPAHLTVNQYQSGQTSYVASQSITFTDGFESGPNANFRAYIDPNLPSSSGSRYFGYELAYDKVSTGTGLPAYSKGQFTGNITGITWRGQANGAKVNRYDFDYDATGRLLKAGFGQLSGGVFSNSTSNFNMQVGDGQNPLTAYDANGNILKQSQYGLTAAGGSSIPVDDLTYQYTAGTNRLAKVTDAITNTAAYNLADFKDGANGGDDYDYDVEGSLIKDENKGISGIGYNLLGLVEQIVVQGKGTISYQYSADGSKLSKTTSPLSGSPRTTLYVGGMVFEDNYLQLISMEAGRIRFNAGNTLVADYFLTDHLGNIRVVVSDDASLPDKVLEENHYYPFGLHMKGMGYQQNIAGVTPNKYKFNAGSELNTDFDIQIYETAFRGLDPQIGRFWQVDPMAGLYLVNSPFHYALNNPIANNDPTGAVTRNDIYGYIGDLYGSGHGGSWEKGKGFSFWGADDPMAWYTGASIIQEFGLYGQLGITDSWEGSRNSFYRSGGRRGSDFLFEGTTTVGEISKPVLVKGKIKNNTWQTNEIIYPDDWGGSSKWLGPENSLGMLKAQAYFEQNAIHNGLEAAQAKAKAEGLDPYHLTKFSDAAQAAIGFRQMSYGAVAILASPFMMEAGVAALPSLSNGIVNAATQIGGAIQNAGISTHFYINSGINSAKDALVYTYLRTLSIQNFAKIVAAQKILMNSIDLKQGDVYAAWSVLGNISGAFVPPLKPRGIPNANTVGLK